MAHSRFNYEKIQRQGAFIPGVFSVMFLDIVRFTKFGDNQALKHAVRDLQNAIQDIFETVDWDRTSELEPNGAIMMPTGDGYGIGFEPSIVKDKDILGYALELSKRMKAESCPVRIGVSKGSCYIHQDLNDSMNLCGWGVIDAERTMSFGDKNHILCNGSFAKDLKDHDDDLDLHLIGKYSAKHGRKIDLYNYYSNDFGNKKTPPKK